MADDLSSAFLQSYFRTKELGAQRQQFQAEQMFKQAQLAAENQRAAATLDSQRQYQQAMLGNDKTRLDMEAQRNKEAQTAQAFALQLQGAVPTAPVAAPQAPQGAGVMNTQPMSGQNPGPAMPMRDQNAASPIAIPGGVAPLQLAPPGAAEIDGQFLRVPQAGEKAAQAYAEGKARLDQLHAVGIVNDDQYTKMQQIYGLGNALGHPLNEAEASIISPKPTAVREGDEPLSDAQIQQANTLTQQLGKVNNIDTSGALLKKGATRHDLAEVNTRLGQINSATATKAQNEMTNGFKEALVNISQGRLDLANQKQMIATYAPVTHGASLMNDMTVKAEAALGDNHNQQAMLGLLMDHIGMTMADLKGGRVTQSVIEEAIKSRKLPEGLKAQYGTDGILTGVVLTPRQIGEMVENAHTTFADKNRSVKESATAQGITEGPKMTPSPSTMRYYIHRNNGNVAKAKEEAASAGWSVDK